MARKYFYEKLSEDSSSQRISENPKSSNLNLQKKTHIATLEGKKTKGLFDELRCQLYAAAFVSFDSAKITMLGLPSSELAIPTIGTTPCQNMNREWCPVLRMENSK